MCSYLEGAENLCYLGRCPTERDWSWLSARTWDDLRLVSLKLTFLIVSRVMSLLRLSRREVWWKGAEILMLPSA